MYFYFHGLSLLNPKGTFSFITSNSWLDVGYGKDLQEFLLRHCHVKLVLDNQSKRSFASADVNTVIVLFSHANDRKEWGLPQVAHFVMFKAPFEHMLSPRVFSDIAGCDGRKATAEYRVLPVAQRDLLDAGLSSVARDDEEDTESGKRKTNRQRVALKTRHYEGEKWGGKYLRAPDIYWTIVERCGDKLIRLGQIADVRFGIKTGANEFFYPKPDVLQEWDVEKRFLKPVILRPADILTPEVTRDQLDDVLFLADVPRNELHGTNAEKYVRWGEKRGFHETASCAARGQHWYRLEARDPAALVMPIVNKMRLVLGINQGKAQISDNCVEIRPHKDIHPLLVAALMLGSFNYLLRHTEGRSYGRMIKVQTYEAERLLIHDPRSLSSSECTCLLRALEQLKAQPFQWLAKELETPARKALDEAWLVIHGFSSEPERSAALRDIHAAVRSVSAEMDAQEEDWIGDRGAVRVDGNPQDVMKRKRHRTK